MILSAKFNMFVNEQGFLQVNIEIPGHDLMEVISYETPSQDVRSDLFFTVNEILRGLDNEPY